MLTYIKDITDFIFLEDQPRKADIIFVPGNQYPDSAERAASLWKAGFAPYVLPSGRYSITKSRFEGPLSGRETYGGDYASEWEFMADVLRKNGVSREAILKEDEATYTYQNAICSRKATDRLGLTINSAILCCKAQHTRRCLMYYETLYPKTRFYLCPAAPGVLNITRDNWFQTEEGINTVLGELERCGGQFGYILKEILLPPDASDRLPSDPPLPG